jgi:hypothetical protein
MSLKRCGVRLLSLAVAGRMARQYCQMRELSSDERTNDERGPDGGQECVQYGVAVRLADAVA